MINKVFSLKLRCLTGSSDVRIGFDAPRQVAKLDALLSRREADGLARLQAAKDEWRRPGLSSARGRWEGPRAPLSECRRRRRWWTRTRSSG